MVGVAVSCTCNFLRALVVRFRVFETVRNPSCPFQRRIVHNALMECECLIRENDATKEPISTLADSISKKINELASDIRASPLLYSRDPKLRALVLTAAVPKILLEQVGGVDGFLQRVPEAYCQWIFASYLASHYVYTQGLETTEFTFMAYVSELRKGSITLTN